MILNPRKSAARATATGGTPPTLSKTRIVSAGHQLVRRFSSRVGGLLPRSFKKEPFEVARAAGHSYILEDGREVYDASCGASVSFMGPGPNDRIKAAARAQEDKVSYVCGYSLTVGIAKEYARELLKTTDGVMKDVIFYGSGEFM